MHGKILDALMAANTDVVVTAVIITMIRNCQHDDVIMSSPALSVSHRYHRPITSMAHRCSGLYDCLKLIVILSTTCHNMIR